ncbi:MULTISPECIES: TetR/AcrR family transcriptional regulator [unclassified Clostridioides]|uniref:TetR/AcrR family transcriptional regulator n=1 Tax=unclassified Clostridioides TaxID=2635829 RepID=UPI001D0C458D|nr:TetR/AcrR family transcriptional regulator [Clostridioides sp. ES-S-0001-03]MCC0703521.1 TetR/AcrR family transcriptional regulator [Clostridioides sp. ES-S-0049-02]
MARKPILEGGKREEILKCALQLFLKNGYESTSIRMILNEVGGEVGMFYHYFSSKQELFDEALRLFMKIQGERTSKLMSQKSDKISPRMRLEQLIECYDSGMDEFSKLSDGAIHWSVLSSIHSLTLEAILPSFRTMIIEILRLADKKDLSESKWLAPFVLKGISGLLHDKSFAELSKEKQMLLIINLLCRTLQVPYSLFEE